jgi:hypothetical protein
MARVGEHLALHPPARLMLTLDHFEASFLRYNRKRPCNTCAGCKLCKPWKVNGFATERKDGEKFSDHRRRKVAEEQARDWKQEGTNAYAD